MRPKGAADKPRSPANFGLKGHKHSSACRKPLNPNKGGLTLAKPNYEFQKRQKELEKKRKKEEKKLRKEERAVDPAAPESGSAPTATEPSA
jgi:hypothetical protein